MQCMVSACAVSSQQPGHGLQGGVMLQCCSVDTHWAHSAVGTQAAVLQAGAAGKLTAAFPLQSVGSVVETRPV